MKCGVQPVTLLLVFAFGCAIRQPSAKSGGQSAQTEWPRTEANKSEFYVTDKEVPYGDTPPFSEEQIENAKHAKESRPAEQDPEGNWGPVAEGFQFSLRFEKDAYTNGEPISACVILRNVSDRVLKYPYEYTADEREISFVLSRGEDRVYGKYDVRPGASFQERVRSLRTDPGGIRPSPVGSQHKSLVNLNQIYGLTTSGEYHVQAMHKIPTSNLTSMTNVASGKATFRIFDPPK